MEIKGWVLSWHKIFKVFKDTVHICTWKKFWSWPNPVWKRKEETRLRQKLLLGLSVGSLLPSLQRVTVENICKECPKVPLTCCFHGEDQAELCCQALMIKFLFPSCLPCVWLINLTFHLNYLLFFTPSWCRLSFTLYSGKSGWSKECVYWGRHVCCGCCRCR